MTTFWGKSGPPKKGVTPQRQITCRWCPFKCMVWWTSKKGTRHSGWDTMYNHILDKHFEHVAEIDDISWEKP